MELPLYYEDIAKLLPHRYPFLLVDRITELDLGKRIVGMKNVSANEPFFQGHFPENPIMPGVLIVEAMAQVGGVMARLTRPEVLVEEGAGGLFFMAIDKVKFRRPVVPGDQLVFELEALRAGSKVWKMAGKAFVDGNIVAEAQLLASIG